MHQPYFQPPAKKTSPDVWRRYLRLFMRRWWVLLLLMSISVCYRAYRISQLPEEYVSTAKLVLQGRFQIKQTSNYQEEITNLFGTQKEILLSRQLKARVQDHLEAVHPDLARSPVALKITRDNFSGVITITGRGSNGRYAQVYLNSTLDQYMELRSEMRTNVSDETLGAINAQLDQLATKIKEQEAAVTEYHRKNDMTVLQDGKNTSAAYLAELLDKRADLGTKLNFLRQLDIEQDINRRSEASVDPEDAASGPYQLSNSEREFLAKKREIAMLEVEHAQLSKIMKPRHPKIRDLNDRLQKAKALLNVFRQQSEQLNRQRALSLEVELRNLEQEIDLWKQKSLDASRRIAESTRLTEDLQRTRSLHEKLLLSMHEVDQAHQLDQDNFSIMERASSPSQVRRSSSKDLLVAAAFGLMLGVGVLLILNRFDDRLYTVGEFSDRFELSLLGTIPEIPADQTNEVIHPDDERTLFAESYRKLRSSILYRQWDREVPQTMLVTSAIPFDGKSTVASNLAAVLARSGSEVLLIDGDLRRGALHQRFGTDGALGFGNVIRGELPIFEAITQTDATNLDFLPRGTTSNTTAEAFLKPSTQQLFTELKAVYDYIVIDSAPVLVADDTLSLAPLVDTSLFVIRLDRTPARFAEKAIQALDQRQVEVGGAVLNFDQSFTGEYYAYDYAKYYAKFANT